MLEVREQWQDGKLVGFGSSLQGIELLQLLSREFFERGSNRPFLDIHFFSRQVFELLHGECQRFQAERVTRGKQGRAEGHIIDKGDTGQRVLVVAKAVPLVCDLDGPSPKEQRQNETEHVPIPAIAHTPKPPLQCPASPGVFVAVAVLTDEIIEHFLRDVCSRVGHQLGTVLDDKPEAVFTGVEDLWQCLQVHGLEEQLCLVTLEWTCTQIELWIEVRDHNAQELFQDLAEVLAQ